jgi:predicted secreted protein
MRWIVLGSAYAILWFLALQILLPIGIKPGEGTAPTEFADTGVPYNPRIGLKILIATITAALIWAVFYALVLLNIVNI